MKFLTHKKFSVALAVFLLLAGLTVVAWYLLSQNADRQLATQFQDQSVQITSLVQSRLDLYTNVLYGAQGLFAASNSVQSNEWGYYAQQLDIPHNYSGISAIFFIQHVPASATSSYPYQIYPASQKQDYYPFTYLYSVTATTTATTSAVLGFDTSSDPTRWKAIQRSLQTGKPSASAEVLTITTHVPSFSIYAPVYTEGLHPTSASERASEVTGFVGAGFRLDNLFHGLAADPVFDKDIDVEIYDSGSLSNVSSSTILYDSDSHPVGLTNPVLGPFSRTSHIVVAGRTWTLYFYALPAYRARAIQTYVPLVALGGGLAASLLISWLIFLYASSRERAVAIAKRMTSDLAKSQQLVKASMENAGDMIVIIRRDRTIVDANPMACSVLGYTKDEMLAITGDKIFTPAAGTDIQDLFTILIQKKAMTIEGHLRRKDGSIFPVEIRTSIFGDDLINPFAISIIRDTSERKEAEARLLERTEELERMNKLMVDRELTMVDLKDQLANAKKQQSE